MKQQNLLTDKLPDQNNYFGLTSPLRRFIKGLSKLGVVYLQARTDCGGVGKFCDLSSVYIDSENETICAPESGLVLSLDGLVAIHATGDERTYAFDFEFAERPCGFSIYVMPHLSDLEGYVEIVSQYFGESLDKTYLDDWRTRFTPPGHHCENCEQAGDVRAANPRQHPVYTIANQLIESERDVYCRLLSGHTDLSAHMTPDNLVVHGGVVSIADIKSTVIALNMRNLHALVVREKKIDGADFSAIEIYNSIGVQGFEFLVEDSSLVGEWAPICKAAQP